MTKLEVKQNFMPNAWLVSWVAFGDEDRIFAHHKIKNKIIDIRGPRVKLERIRDVVEEYYVQNELILSGRLSFQHYTKGTKRRGEFFKLVPTYSSYQCVEYAALMKVDTPENRKAWEACPKYCQIGHNPAIEIREVFNLEWCDRDGKLYLGWEQANADGTWVREEAVYEK